MALLLVDDVVPVVFGDEFEGAVDAFGPALGLVVLAPLASGLVQVAALRMRPQVVLTSGAAALVVFVLVAAVAVPAWDAAGATAAALAGVAAGAATSLALLPRSADTWVAATSFLGAAGVTLLAVVA